MERLPTPEDCPECSTQPRGGQRSSVFQRLGHPPMHLPRHASPEQDRHETSSRKREECHLPQWCPEGLSKSQKQRIQLLRCLEQAEENYLRLLK